MILTQGGHVVRPVDPNPVVLEDIAKSLGRICRWGGHCEPFYSVAEHSVRVSAELAKNGHSPKVVMLGLMHDAMEAYMGDVVRSLKKTMWIKMSPGIDQTYYITEKDGLISVLYQLGIIKHQDEITEDDWAAVKDMDDRVLATEFRDLMPDCTDPRIIEQITSETLAEITVPMAYNGEEDWHEEAAELFLSVFDKIKKQMEEGTCPHCGQTIEPVAKTYVVRVGHYGHSLTEVEQSYATELEALNHEPNEEGHYFIYHNNVREYVWYEGAWKRV